MLERRRLVAGMVCLCCMATGLGTVFAEETQDSPLYAYTLRTALERMDGQTTETGVAVPDDPMTVVSPPEPEFLQGPTSQPIGPTVCHHQKTLCPVRTTACPAIDPTNCPRRTTRCPTYTTECPQASTTCPALHTRCPGGATNCPLQRTQCPVHDTICPPAAATVCPQKTTECPTVTTQCPVNVTTCPPRTTQCGVQATHCPMNATTCPPRSTRCPAQATQCPLDQTTCPQWLTKCPSDVPTACPQKTTQCPARQTVCPGGVTNCPIANTACPVVGTMCPAAACVPGGPVVNFVEPGTTTIEFSYDRANPGVLVVYCQMSVNAVAAALPDIQNGIRLVIEPVGIGAGQSLLQWWAPNPVPPGGTSVSPWVGTTLGQPANTHPLMGKARLNNDPASTAFGNYEVSAIFTGLPDRNDYFGGKMVYAQIVDTFPASATFGSVLATSPIAVEVFYDRIGRTWYIPNPFAAPVDPNPPPYNNPGTGTNYGPNWFYYWKNPQNTTNNNARVVLGSPHDWQYYHEYTYGFYVPGEDHVNVGAVASWVNSGPEYYQSSYTGAWINIAGLGVGPHCCAETVAHEGLHKAIYETWGPLITLAEGDGEDDGDPYDDPDDDLVPNVRETGFMWDRGMPAGNPVGAPVRPPAVIVFNPNDPDTYNLAAIFGGYATYGDQEVLCRALEIDISIPVPGLAAGGMSVDDTWDWCMPGTNSNPAYAPGANPWPW